MVKKDINTEARKKKGKKPKKEGRKPRKEGRKNRSQGGLSDGQISHLASGEKKSLPPTKPGNVFVL